ncbi:MAG: D-alanyl-D-alanine carboxypeptidase family protein [bacterium]|jgi:D-alanyl-D-alanine carboxypeptidase (penicillin-binding protein 5/6)
MRKPLCFLLLLCLLAAVPGRACAAPVVTAEAAVLINAQTGQVLYAQNADRKMYPASTTKILTAIIALEQGDPDDWVTTSVNARATAGTSLYLEVGEEETLRDLLYALLLRSANDAAVAIAEHIAGSADAFVAAMNAKAAVLRATDSNFTNPHGLHDEAHYSTARDLARLAAYALQNPAFREIVATRQTTMPWPGEEWDRTLDNLNQLLSTYKGATGVKTGYPTQAGQCLVASAARAETELIAVVLKTVGNNVWTDAAALLDYGFTAFTTSPAVSAGEAVTELKIPFAGSTRLLAAATLPVSREPDREPLIGREITVTRGKTPVQAGDVVGRMDVTVDGTPVGAVDLVAESAVTRQFYTRWWFWLLLLFLIFRLDVFRRRWRRRYYRRYTYIGSRYR